MCVKNTYLYDIIKKKVLHKFVYKKNFKTKVKYENLACPDLIHFYSIEQGIEYRDLYLNIYYQ